MKRRHWVIKVFGLLLIGAVINVAVTLSLLGLPSKLEWRLYEGMDWMGDVAGAEDAALLQKTCNIDREIKPDQCIVFGSERLGWTLKEIEFRPSWDKEPVDTDRTWHWMEYFSCGVPARAVEGYFVKPFGRDAFHSGAFATPQFLSRMGWRFDLIPFRPLWPGFAINTLFYAAIAWGLFVVPDVLRRKRRIRRGLCPSCAYPMGTSVVCTECGRALKLRRIKHM